MSAESLALGRPLARLARLKMHRSDTPFGEVLVGLLTAKGWSIRDLASAVGMKHQNLSVMLRSPHVRIETMNKLLEPFGYKAEILIEPIEGFFEKKGEAS